MNMNAVSDATYLSDVAMQIAIEMEAQGALNTTTAEKAEAICDILSGHVDPALTAQKPVVKPLEWVEREIIGGIGYFAETPAIVLYAVSKDPMGGYCCAVDGNRQYPSLATLEKAKAAAQADYERRILSALTQAPVVSDVMVERAHEAGQALYRTKPLADPREAARVILEAALTTQPTSAEVEGSRCDDCHAPNPVWFAPNHLWNRVMGGEAATDDPGGIVCVHCFIKRAEAAGIKPTAWVLDVEISAPADQAELPVVGWRMDDVIMPQNSSATLDEAWAGYRAKHPNAWTVTPLVRQYDALRLIAERDAEIEKAHAANNGEYWEEKHQSAEATIARLREARREYLEASEAVFDWMNGNDLSADHAEQKPEDFELVSSALAAFRDALRAQGEK